MNYLNDYENTVHDWSGLTIPRFALIRNRVKCNDCGRWFRASKYLPKEVIQDDKDDNAYEAAIHPVIMCGKCGKKYWTKTDAKSVPRKNQKISKRRQKKIRSIRQLQKAKAEEYK